MVDNLPLIPAKNAVCTDVRAVLRSVFRELDYLPPLTVDGTAQEMNKSTGNVGTGLPNVNDPWTEKYKSECTEIWNEEDKLGHQRARRIARQPLPNIYKLHRPEGDRDKPDWKQKRALIDRKDLVPEIQENAGRDESLWIRNILNVSSGNIAATVPSSSRLLFESKSMSLVRRRTAHSAQSFSIGAVLPCPALQLLPALSAPRTPPYRGSPCVDCIVCVPPEIYFVNFVVGCMHLQTIRLINVSKSACRLSLTPPRRRELDLEICGSRGLTVTSGAAAELKVHFRPKDALKVTDEIHVRVTSGQTFIIPIACYMEPPILSILLPNESNAVLKSTLGMCSDTLELGTRLLGDVHCACVHFSCNDECAAFFVVTDDAWINWEINCLTNNASVRCNPFMMWPAWWAGGGTVRGCVWCLAGDTGTHVTVLRVLASTAINRELTLLADVIFFKPSHLVIEAHEKDYDICSDNDPACEYYVDLGTAFPHRSLTKTVQLVNKSPVLYNYYWTVRPWGVCYCWEHHQPSDWELKPEEQSDSEPLCPGAKETKQMMNKDPGAYEARSVRARLVRVEATQGQILPHSSCAVHVRVPDVGGEHGVVRAVLMLILRDIPRESIAKEYEEMIISTQEIKSPQIPGIRCFTREVCEVLCAQMEVWWHVTPLKFVLDPPVMPLYHSRRVTATNLHLTAWQLLGVDKSRASWVTPAHVSSLKAVYLKPAYCTKEHFKMPLTTLYNNYPETDVLTLVTDQREWRSSCTIRRQCTTRHPALQPALVWLGVVAPGEHMKYTLRLHNDTFQKIYFWVQCFRWLGDNVSCPARTQIPCERCMQRTCACAILKPTRGTIDDGERKSIHYDDNAPVHDGMVATLVQVRRCEAGLAQVAAAPGTESRATLIAYRVVAPKLNMRVLPCGGPGLHCSEGCGVDAGARSSKTGTATLRPSGELVLGRRTCYRLQFTNSTPLPTAVHFDSPIDSTDVLKVMFYPNELKLRSYGVAEIRVVLEARSVCQRRLFVYRANVVRAHKPLYLIVDTAISGVQVSCQVPIGGDVNTDDFVIMRRTQREKNSAEMSIGRPPTIAEIFAEEERKRAFVKANVCGCRSTLVYIPPERLRPSPPTENCEEATTIEIVTEPPPLTRVCDCAASTKPPMADAPASVALRFYNVPLKKVCERRLLLRNESVVTARWSVAVRKWTRRPHKTLDKDTWAGGVCDSGLALAVSPPSGVLPSSAEQPLLVRVYADCWGLYHDQILIQVEKVEPIVLDVWVQAVGPPLQFKMQPNIYAQQLLTMWMSSSNPVRSLCVKNVSRSELVVHAYVTRQHEWMQDTLPFRLYLRFYDVPPITCPCITGPDEEMEEMSEESEGSSVPDVDTGLELYLAPDHGPQHDTYYKVEPKVCSMKPGVSFEWEMTLNTALARAPAHDVAVLLRTIPLDNQGDGWYRCEPPPAVVHVRQVAHEPGLRLSTEEIVVSICALDLPARDTMRIRKRFTIRNVSVGTMWLSAHTSVPWCIILEQSCADSKCRAAVNRDAEAHMELPSRSSTEICVEVCLSSEEVWPAATLSTAPFTPPSYEQRRRDTTPLYLYDDFEVHKTLALVVELDYPVISATPPLVDFGCVTDHDQRKTYVCVSHSSSTATLHLQTQWAGHEEFQIWPPLLHIPPGSSERVYIQYTAVWRHGPAEGYVTVSVCDIAGGCRAYVQEEKDGASDGRSQHWCRASVSVRATPSRDHKCSASVHDYTDDTHLTPTHR